MWKIPFCAIYTKVLHWATNETTLTKTVLHSEFELCICSVTVDAY